MILVSVDILHLLLVEHFLKLTKTVTEDGLYFVFDVFGCFYYILHVLEHRGSTLDLNFSVCCISEWFGHLVAFIWGYASGCHYHKVRSESLLLLLYFLLLVLAQVHHSLLFQKCNFEANRKEFSLVCLGIKLNNKLIFLLGWMLRVRVVTDMLELLKLLQVWVFRHWSLAKSNLSNICWCFLLVIPSVEGNLWLLLDLVIILNHYLSIV